VFRHEPEVYDSNTENDVTLDPLPSPFENGAKSVIENGKKTGCRAQIIGHFHPKMRTSISRRRYSGKCFISTNQLFVMPAFGQFTGGLDIDDEVMLGLLAKNERNMFMLYDGIIFKT
jgi:metallophosphoesterase superfamily enzyme